MAQGKFVLNYVTYCIHNLRSILANVIGVWELHLGHASGPGRFFYNYQLIQRRNIQKRWILNQMSNLLTLSSYERRRRIKRRFVFAQVRSHDHNFGQLRIRLPPPPAPTHLPPCTTHSLVVHGRNIFPVIWPSCRNAVTLQL